jgi:hypothetical protein
MPLPQLSSRHFSILNILVMTIATPVVISHLVTKRLFLAARHYFAELHSRTNAPLAVDLLLASTPRFFSQRLSPAKARQAAATTNKQPTPVY